MSEGLVEPGAVREAACIIGRNAVVKDGVILGNNVIIEDGCIIGYNNLTKIYDGKGAVRPTVIGEGTLVRSGTVIYAGCTIGKGCRIGHNVVLREETKVGDGTSIGCLVKCEGYTTIGQDCSIHAQSHLTSFMTIEDLVFMGPGVLTMNDTRIDYRRNIGNEVKGPTIRRAVRIGGGVIICPGVEVGENSFIGAGSLLSRDVPPGSKVMTGGGKVCGEVEAAERL